MIKEGPNRIPAHRIYPRIPRTTKINLSLFFQGILYFTIFLRIRNPSNAGKVEKTNVRIKEEVDAAPISAISI